MSQFSHINDIQNLVIMDSELMRGQAPRWMKNMKRESASSFNMMNNTSINTSKLLSVSYNQYNATNQNAGSKTPNKTSQGKKTPGKSPSKLICKWHKLL